MTEVNETREWIVAGAAVAAALGTLLAVLVALYRDTWREWRSRPFLSLHLDPIWSESNRDLFWQQGQAPAHWLRLKVMNKKGRRSAEDVEVLVTAFYALGDDDERWQPPLDTHPLRWSAMEDPRVQVPPGVSRHVDLLTFPAPAASDGHGGYLAATPEDEPRTTGVLCVRQEGASTSSGSAVSNLMFENHRYRVELAVVARDIDSRAYAIEVEFDGRYRYPPDFWGKMTLTCPQPIEKAWLRRLVLL
jgi:hypothetical protein